MNRFADLPIRSKLLTVEMLTVTCALLLACVGFIATDVEQLRNQKIRDLQTLAKLTGLESVAALTFHDRDVATEILAAYRVKPSIEAARIYDEKGEPFASYIAHPASGFALPATLSTQHMKVTLRRIEVAEPIVLKGRRIGTIYITANVQAVTHQMRNYAIVSIGILIAALAMAFGISFRLQRAISGPIVMLAKVAEDISRRKDYSVRVPMAPGHDEIGNLIVGFNDMLAEIERRDADLEMEVAARTAQIKRILDTAGEGIFGLDSDGRATFVNPSAASMLGRRADELVGVRLHDLIHVAASDGASKPFDNCLVCDSAAERALRVNTDSFQRSDGSAMPVEYTASVIVRDDGSRDGVVVTFRDISERLAVEKLKSEFVSTVSHELRTPLTSIRGSLGLLAAGLLGSVTPRGNRMLEIAINNTDRLVRLINDILDLERLDSGRMELHRRLIDANDLMQQAAEVMQAMAERAGTTLTVEPRSEMLFADPDRMLQVLTNLLSNAIKFSPPGGRIALSTAIDGHQFVFRVADQGRGIPAEKLDMIFERFKQVDASDSRDKGGTGLGLAICRSIAGAHGGRIWAESREGEGSVFNVAIPLPDASAPSATQAESVDAHTKPIAEWVGKPGPLVLIVEDEADLARIMTASLERRGIQTMHAATGRAAVDCVVATRPDLIVLDLTLPEMDGFAVVDWLKESNTLTQIPLIVYSALELDLAQQERLRLGRTEFLIKSRVSLEQFEAEVMHLLNEVTTTETEVEGAA